MIGKAARRSLEEALGDRIRFDVPMSRFTSLRVGGPADALDAGIEGEGIEARPQDRVGQTMGGAHGEHLSDLVATCRRGEGVGWSSHPERSEARHRNVEADVVSEGLLEAATRGLSDHGFFSRSRATSRAPSVEMLPAPSVITRSPGADSFTSRSRTVSRSGTKWTFRCP